jgi:hypothetical protein
MEAPRVRTAGAGAAGTVSPGSARCHDSATVHAPTNTIKKMPSGQFQPDVRTLVTRPAPAPMIVENAADRLTRPLVATDREL